MLRIVICFMLLSTAAIAQQIDVDPRLVLSAVTADRDQARHNLDLAQGYIAQLQAEIAELKKKIETEKSEQSPK